MTKTKDHFPIKHIHLLKNYTAQYHKKHFVLNSESQQEIGRITDETKSFILHQCIEYQSQVYEIKNVGFMKNDVELSLAKRIIYFTDFGKDRIIRSGQDVRIYYFKIRRISTIIEKGKVLVKIWKVKKWFKEPIYHIEADESVDDLLILLFLHYSTREFNGIDGGD